MSQIIDEILLIVSTPHPLKLMSEEELFAYGELCHNFIFLGRGRDIAHKDEAISNLRKVIKECALRLKTYNLDLHRQSLLQRRLAMWCMLIDDDAMLDEAKRLARGFLQKAEQSSCTDLDVLYSAVFMTWGVWGTAEGAWAEAVKREWRETANNLWARESLDFEQSYQRLLVIVLQDKPLKEKIITHHLKGISPEEMQLHLWQQFQFMPFALLPFPSLLSLAETHLSLLPIAEKCLSSIQHTENALPYRHRKAVANEEKASKELGGRPLLDKSLSTSHPSNALAYQIYASLLLSLITCKPWPSQISSQLLLPVALPRA